MCVKSEKLCENLRIVYSIYTGRFLEYLCGKYDCIYSVHDWPPAIYSTPFCVDTIVLPFLVHQTRTSLGDRLLEI